MPGRTLGLSELCWVWWNAGRDQVFKMHVSVMMCLLGGLWIHRENKKKEQDQGLDFRETGGIQT